MSNYDSSTLVLTLPMPPSVNDFYGYTSPSKHRIIKYVKEAGKEFKRKVKDYVILNSFDIKANVPLKVEVILNFKTKQRTDLDNRMKGLLDSLTEAEVWQDDSLIDDLHIIRGYSPTTAGVIVIITEADICY